ncbi:uncharacterized protein LOC129577615 [Sitodiplosis mosellana]|uniref:uncharacterized protein LOC129577615 n=1 Tax=Sitodiplosis mosellana TaxID=263140 RepID=UPI002443DF2F|nr:uncharacterized protein LOC129577615 [Sitodiplosis mosellana]XP_055321108.1 uncharacterized protein LOC129577615 [Sitodiplosis mosellana]
MENAPEVLLLNPRPNDYLSLLNERELVNIFKHLDLYELLQISELDVNYQRIIGERIISKQTLDVSKVSRHYDTRQLFKQFGEYVTDLKVHESDIQYKDDQYTFIEEIFRLINKRCTVGRLKSISIGLNREAQHMIRTVPNVFCEISSLSVYGDYFGQLSNLLEQVIPKCSKLCSLEITRMSGNWNFLISPQLQMLQTLEIKYCQIPHSVWAHFIRIGIQSLTSLVIKQNAFSFDEPETPMEKVTRTWLANSIGIKFPNLKELVLINCHPGLLFDGSKFTQLEKISFNARGMLFISDSIKYMTNLRSVEFSEYSTISVFEDFLQLPLLSEFILNAHDIGANVITAIVAASRYLRVLRLNSRKPRIAWTLYNELVIERATRWPDAPPLHMYARFKDFQRHKPNVITIHRIN